MSPWPWVVMVVGLIACKKDECPAVRTDTTRATSSQELARGRTAIERYQKACH